MKKYILIFSGTYLVGLVVYLVISELLGISSSANLVVLALGAVVAGRAFVNDKGRPPAKDEKRGLVWGSLLGAWLMSGALVLAYLLLTAEGRSILPELRQVPMWIWGIAFCVVNLISVGVLALCYGWLTAKYAANKTTQ